MKFRTKAASSVLVGAALLAATPGVAFANSQYGCTAPYGTGHLHATSTLINYGSAKGTAVYNSATTAYKEVRTFGTDHDWHFKSMTLSGYTTKTSNPSQWGSSTSPLNFSTKYVKVTWTALGGEISTSCTVRVGA